MKKFSLLIIGLSSFALSDFTPKKGVIIDNNSQLEWQNREVTELEWDKAQSYCSELSLDGKGWRLPSKEELVSLIEEKSSSSNNLLNKKFSKSNKNSLVYWTATPSSNAKNQGWVVDFQRGWLGSRSKYWGFSVRCVRGEFQDNLSLAKTFGTIGKESKPFTEEKEGVILMTTYVQDTSSILSTPSFKKIK